MLFRSLESTGRADRKLSFVRMQQKPFAENVISQADYIYFKNRLREDDEWLWYFVIRFFAATGVRVNELTKLKVEDVKLGHLDIYSKGGKVRRIYIPKALQEETLFWLREICRQSGFLFLNRYGSPITPRGISGQLKKFAVRYHINPDVVYRLHRYLCRQVQKHHTKSHSDTCDGFFSSTGTHCYAEHGIYLTTKERRRRIFIPLTDGNQYKSQIYVKLIPERNGVELKAAIQTVVHFHSDYVNQVGISLGMSAMLTTHEGHIYRKDWAKVYDMQMASICDRKTAAADHSIRRQA